MAPAKSIHPVIIGWLTLPYGLALGWIGSLDLTLIENGFSIGAILSMLMAVEVLGWRIIVAPLVDTIGSLRRWYLAGLGLVIGGMLPFFWLSLVPGNEALIRVLLFVSRAGGVLTLLAATGFLARHISAEQVGKAAGWYQAGLLGARGLAAAIASHLPHTLSWQIISLVEMCAMLTTVIVLFRIPSGGFETRPGIKEIAAQAVSDGKSWFRSFNGIFTTIMALSPIGVGAAVVAWNIGTELYAIPIDQAKRIAGTYSIIASVLGFLIGGWAADRFGRWKTWFWAGSLLAFMALLLAFCPFVKGLFITGMLTYTVLAGCCTAAFWAIIVQAVKPRLVITKITLLSMLTVLSTMYMQTFDGSTTDNYSFQVMLIGEAVLTFICIGIALLVLRGRKIDGQN